MLQVTPAAVAIWPIAGDVPDLETIIADQAETIAANAVLIDAYQANLNTAQNPPPGTASTGTGDTAGIASTSVTVNAIVGTITKGATITTAVTAVTIPPNTTVLGQISGTTGGNGVYLVSNPVTLTAVPLTFTPLPPPSTWPTPNDAPTLLLITQQQSSILRTQSALLQHYVDLLNTSQTTAPPTGP